MYRVVSPEIADLDEVSTVVVEKRLAHQDPQDGEPDGLSLMIGLFACVLLPLTWSSVRHCSPHPIVEDCSDH